MLRCSVGTLGPTVGVMAFFEPPPPEPPPAPRPPWAAPPNTTFGVPVPTSGGVDTDVPAAERVVARGPRAVIVLREVRAYPHGALLRMSVAARRAYPPRPEDPDDAVWSTPMGVGLILSPPRAGQRLAAERVRFGVDYHDGRTATDLHPFSDLIRYGGDAAGPAPEPPSLRAQTSRGRTAPRGLFDHDVPLWLWPLPPPIAFDLAVEWPAFDIEVTRTELDGAAIAAAGARARPFWPEPGQS